MSFLLSIRDPRELSELCATLFPSIWITKRKTSFQSFIVNILNSTKTSSTTLLLALYYIQQLNTVYPTTKGCGGSEARLFTTALVLANKYLEDSVWTNKTWSRVSKIHVQELNRMEVEFLSALDYHLCVQPSQFHQWIMHCQQLFSNTLLFTTLKIRRDGDEEGRKRRMVCRPMLSWSSSVSALTSSSLLDYKTIHSPCHPF